jgi:hypothetical protein
MNRSWRCNPIMTESSIQSRYYLTTPIYYGF